MFEQNRDIREKLKQITNAIKICSLLFSGIALCQYYFNKKSFYESLADFLYIYLLIIFGILAIYIVLDKLDGKSSGKSSSVINWVYAFILMCIALTSVIMTGGFESGYKYLFLFVIMSTSIELGMIPGVVISGLSSFFILGMDLLFAPVDIKNAVFQGDIVLACAFFIIAVTIGYYVKIENDHIAHLNSEANVDGLTGLYNHRCFYEQLSCIKNECDKKHSILSLLFIDIDFFKYFNDVNGHQKGDLALWEIACILVQNVRKNDLVARYGGEEFAVILPDTDEDEAIEIAEKLRRAVSDHVFSGQEFMPDYNLTISLGVSVYPSKAKTEDEIIRFADEALYRAKSFRKNRVESYSSILDDLKNDVSDNDKEIIASIKTLIGVINSRDKYTFRHVERVVTFCGIIADELKFDAESKKSFIYSAYLHDIGKINIPAEILIKSNSLSPEEWSELQKHPEIGAEMLKNVSTLKDVVPIILQHHEHYDGSGYPFGLKGNEITYLARLLNIVDSFDAMTSYRPYQKKRSYSEAFEELRRNSGKQFDPELVDIFIDILKDEKF